MLIDNWDVDIESLYNFCLDLGAATLDTNIILEEELRDEAKDTLNRTIFYFEKARSILEPWRMQIGLEERESIDSLDEEKINLLYGYLSDSESRIGACYHHLHNYKKVVECCDRAISCGKSMMMEEERSTILYHVLTTKGRS
jgi:hypothetical protein